MFALRSTAPQTVSPLQEAHLEAPNQAGPKSLRAPDAPSTPHTRSQTRLAQHPSQFGAFVGRLSKVALGATLGASLLLSGCASLGSSIPEGPVASVPQLAQQVTHFSPAADGLGWVLAAEPSHTAPAQMANILDLVARARFSDDGKFAIVLDPKVGSRVHQSPWNHTELRSLVRALENYAAGGSFAKVDAKTANAFFDEIIPVFSEVGPAAHAGMGLDVSALNDVREHLLTLEKQQLEARGQG